MKKFLFTLAALLMVGTAYADNYLYIEDFEVTPEFLAQTSGKAREMTLDVKAHFDQYTSAFQAWIISPEGITNRDALAGEAMTQSGYTRTGNPIDRSVALSVSEGVDIFISAWTESDWYYPEGLDPDEDDPVAVGSVKWAPGDYNQMFTLTVRFAQTFTGGDIMVITEPSCAGTDPRGECCPKGEHWEVACHVTVAGGEPAQTPAPVIEVTKNDDAYIFTATGEGEVTIYVDGVPVDNPYTVIRTNEDQIVKLTAIAHVDGQTDGSVTAEYLVPALELADLTGDIVIEGPDENGVVTITYNGDEEVTITVTVNGEEVELGEGGTITVGEGESLIEVTVTGEGYNEKTAAETVNYQPVPPVEKTEMPVITSEETEEGVVVTATGNGHIILMWDEQVMAEGEGTATWTIPYGEDPEGEEFGVSATAQEPGKEVSDPAVATIFVPGQPVVPPTPVDLTGEIVIGEPDATGKVAVSYTGPEEGVEITVEGYELVDGFIQLPDYGTYTITVVAGGEGYNDLTAEQEVTWAEPTDPYAIGAWVVFIDQYGNPQYYELVQGDDPDGVQTNVALTWKLYGHPVSTNPEDWHYIPFYFLVNGVAYGPDADGTEPVMGNANMNPLYENENMWQIQAGYKYVVGIVTDIETGNKYVQISQGTFVDVDELNADKTVAGVRYFNMAGQEMQEANGMTIVVTTYTDGTTNAVKVMK